jgi:hypothetical protein
VFAFYRDGMRPIEQLPGVDSGSIGASVFWRPVKRSADNSPSKGTPRPTARKIFALGLGGIARWRSSQAGCSAGRIRVLPIAGAAALLVGAILAPLVPSARASRVDLVWAVPSE